MPATVDATARSSATPPTTATTTRAPPSASASASQLEHRAYLASLGFDELAPMGSHRFVPRTYEQYRSSLLTLWNMLDNVIVNASVGNPASPGTPFGYMRHVQLEAYSQLVWQRESALLYCEVGFNGGHGVAAMLLANPRLNAVAFELGTRPYSSEAARLLSRYFGEARLRYVLGDSTKTVPAYAQAGGRGTCDVLLVDGAHTPDGAYKDIVNMRALAKPNASLLIDDISEGPGLALRKAERARVVDGVAWHQYNSSSPENPCIRRVRRNRGGSAKAAASRAPSRGFWLCSDNWGWATARYRPG